MIYPDDSAMQRRFIKEAIKENHAVLDGLVPGQPVYQETTIWLPDLKKLANQATEKPKPHLALHRTVPLSLTPEPDMGREEEIAAMLSKNASLKQAEAELNARISQLQRDLEVMQANLAKADEPAPPAEKEKPGKQGKIIRRIPDKTVKKPTTWVPAELVSPSPLHVVTLLSVALAGSGIVWWRRRKPATSSHVETVVITPRVAMPAAAPEDFFPEETVSVDEVASVVEEAKIFTALGRSEQAIQMLEEYVTASPRASAGPWLLLLEMYRAANRQENFTDTAKRFHQALNVITPQWDSDNVSTVYVARSLEEFPHIMERICSGWGGRDVQDFLDSLIQDNRGGERQGFSIEVLQEILTLLSILEMRDQLPELRPF